MMPDRFLAKYCMYIFLVFNKVNQHKTSLDFIFIEKYILSKFGFNIFSYAFQFIISEVCSIQMKYPFFMIILHPSLILWSKFF